MPLPLHKFIESKLHTEDSIVNILLSKILFVHHFPRDLHITAEEFLTHIRVQQLGLAIQFSKNRGTFASFNLPPEPWPTTASLA